MSEIESAEVLLKRLLEHFREWRTCSDDCAYPLGWLKQWGDAREEAGWNAHRTCVRGPAHTHPDDTDRCPLAPNVFERIEQGAWEDPPLTLPSAPESLVDDIDNILPEPPSLLALVREDLDDRREGRAWARITEAIDTLTARVGTVEVSVEDVADAHRRTESRSFRANERLDAVEGDRETTERLDALEEWEIASPGRTIYGHGITPKEAEELMAPYEGARKEGR